METVSMIFQGGYAKIEETKILDRRTVEEHSRVKQMTELDNKNRFGKCKEIVNVWNTLCNIKRDEQAYIHLHC
jgi:hypothetical protein